MKSCAGDCGSWHRSDGGSAIGVSVVRRSARASKLNRKKLYRLYKEERLTGAQAWWSQASSRHPGADGNPAGS